MSESVQVAVRMRPFNGREKNKGCTRCVYMDAATHQTTIRKPKGMEISGPAEKTFTFDYSYDSFDSSSPSYCSQQTVWDDIGEGVLKQAYDGYNCSLFAYGQTGSGKSYSMMGYPATPLNPGSGIIPIAGSKIFERIEANAASGKTMKVECAMVEIYMEKVRDLFNPSAGFLKVRMHPKLGFIVEGLTQSTVTSFEAIERLMEAGTKARTIASTNMNATSSRAHTIFQLFLTQTTVNEDTMKATDMRSVINLIDLAGSERAGNTGASGLALKQGSAINQSLSALGNVIAALAKNATAKSKKKRVRVPYRASVLTQLLKNSLGGNAKTCMIAAVSPADVNYAQTLSTLRYADRAKQIKNKAVKNEDPNDKLIRGLKDQINALKKAMAAQEQAAQPSQAPAGASAEEIAALEAKIKKEKEDEMARFRAEMFKKMEEQQAAAIRAAEVEAAARLAELRNATATAEGVGGNGMSAAEEHRKVETCVHLSNLHEDESFNGQIHHFLDAARVDFGRKDGVPRPDVQLGGLSIKRNHCYTETQPDGSICLFTYDGAKATVNGEPVSSDGDGVVLRHCDRVLLGNHHMYLFIDPTVGGAGGATLDEETKGPGGGGRRRRQQLAVQMMSYEEAMEEANKSQIAMMRQAEVARSKGAEVEQQKMRAKVRAMEEEMTAQRRAAEAAEREGRLRMEALEKQIAAQRQKSTTDSADAEIDALIAELEEEKAEEEEKAAEKAATERERIAELEAQLRARIQETEKHALWKQAQLERRNILDDQLLKTIPLVNEANAMSDELRKGIFFAIKLVDYGSISFAQSSREGHVAGEGALDDSTVMLLQLTSLAAKDKSVMWKYDKFIDRLYMMRDVYQTFCEAERDLDAISHLKTTRDPWYCEPTEELIGTSKLYLDSLKYLLDIQEETPIYNFKGKQQGTLHVAVRPTLLDDNGDAVRRGVGGLEGDVDEEIGQVVGQKMGVSVTVMRAGGLPAHLSADVFVRYHQIFTGTLVQTPCSEEKTINPEWQHKTSVKFRVTHKFVASLDDDAGCLLQFQILGKSDGDYFNQGLLEAQKTPEEERDEARLELKLAKQKWEVERNTFASKLTKAEATARRAAALEAKTAEAEESARKDAEQKAALERRIKEVEAELAKAQAKSGVCAVQ